MVHPKPRTIACSNVIPTDQKNTELSETQQMMHADTTTFMPTPPHLFPTITCTNKQNIYFKPRIRHKAHAVMSFRRIKQIPSSAANDPLRHVLKIYFQPLPVLTNNISISATTQKYQHTTNWKDSKTFPTK